MQLPAARPAQPRGTIERCPRVGEERGIPSRAVLLLEEHEVAVDGARRLARAMEPEQREQPLRLGLARAAPRRSRGRARVRRPRGRGRPRRRRRRPRCASLYITETTVSTMSSRSARSAASGIRSGIPAAPILRLARTIRCATVDSGLQRRARDLRGREPAHRAQGQGELGIRRQRGVTASEQQRKPLVGVALARRRPARRHPARRAARACRGTASRGAAGRGRCAARPG